MRKTALTVILVLTSSAALAQPGGRPPPRSAPPSSPPGAAAPGAPAAPVQAPPYAVVQALHADGTTPAQALTVQCPAGHRVFSAGFTALVRQPPAAGAAPTAQPAYAEGGLDNVRSLPDGRGSAWLVEGVSPDAIRLKQPWRLAVRLVCVQIPGL